MFFNYSAEYACKHVYDACYICSGSYAGAYITVLLLYGRQIAINGYKEHLKTKHLLVQYDTSKW